MRNNTDCDDREPRRNPGAPEVCGDDVADNDCNDETNTFDLDRDGHDDASCGGDDCDDGDPTRYPGNVEVCDSDDEDCDPSTLGFDGDQDGDSYLSNACCNLQPDGSSLCGDDCNDEISGIHPGATEECDLFHDNDCNGENPYDQDGDGHEEQGCGGDDCDDEDAEAHPGRDEVCGDHIDNDCDGFVNDEDCDGHDALENGGDDCDDSDLEVHPGAPERCNALDDDCDGVIPDDMDGDGFASEECGGDDCDDSRADRFPGNPEICEDEIDHDCDGVSDNDPCFVLITAGTFEMGSLPGELGRYDDENQHEVTLTHDYLILSTELTQGGFEALMGYNSSRFSGCPSCPVERVSWHEAAAYCNALSESRGLDRCYDCVGDGIGVVCEPSDRYATPYDCLGYRLPTAAEWEYGARGGTTTATYNSADARLK